MNPASAADPPLIPDCYRYGDRRLKALYFFGHGVYGCFMPYLNLFFTDTLGFGNVQVGMLASLLPLMRIVAPPVWGAASDAVKKPRLLLAGVFVPSLVCLSLLMVRPSYAGALALVGVFAFFYAPMVPLVDGATFKYVARSSHDYGRLRLWGSIGFIVFTAASGLPIYFCPNELRWFFALLIPCGVPACFAALRIPECPPMRRGKVGLRGFVIFKRFPVIVLTLCTFLSWMSMAAYYTFFSHYLKQRNIPVHLIGSVWALGAFFEISVMYYAKGILRRIGVKGLLAAGLAGVVLRLGILSREPPWAIILCTQTLHALTLSAVLVSSVTYINREAPDHLRSSAQGIFSAIVMGLGFGAGTQLAGWLRQAGDDRSMLEIHAGIAFFALVVFLVFFHDKRPAVASRQVTTDNN